VTDDRYDPRNALRTTRDAVATAGAALVAVHARPRLPSTGVHWKDGVVVTTEARSGGRTTSRSPSRTAGRSGDTGGARPAPTSQSCASRPGHCPLATLGDPPRCVRAPGPGPGAPRCGRPARGVRRGQCHPRQVALLEGGEIDRWLQSTSRSIPASAAARLVDAAGRIHGVNSAGLSGPRRGAASFHDIAPNYVEQLVERRAVTIDRHA